MVRVQACDVPTLASTGRCPLAGLECFRDFTPLSPGLPQGVDAPQVNGLIQDWGRSRDPRHGGGDDRARGRGLCRPHGTARPSFNSRVGRDCHSNSDGAAPWSSCSQRASGACCATVPHTWTSSTALHPGWGVTARSGRIHSRRRPYFGEPTREWVQASLAPVAGATSRPSKSARVLIRNRPSVADARSMASRRAA